MDRKSSEFNIKFHISIHGILLSPLRILFSSFQNIEPIPIPTTSFGKLENFDEFRNYVVSFFLFTPPIKRNGGEHNGSAHFFLANIRGGLRI